jgi:hypothetical protein
LHGSNFIAAGINATISRSIVFEIISN